MAFLPQQTKTKSVQRNGTTFLQVNLGQGRVAQNLCVHTATEYQVDILLPSDQSVRSDTAEWYEYESGGTAIMILNPVIRARSLKCSSGFVSVQHKNVKIHSCYFSPNDTRKKFEEEMVELKASTRLQRLIACVKRMAS